MGRYDEFTDEELIAKLRSGEKGIADYLMEKYKGLVRQKARAMFLIGGDTDDLIQEGMIGLFKAVRDYRADSEASFQTFARMCIDRQIYSAIQSSGRQKHIPLNSYVSLDGAEAENMEESWEENPESILIDRENVSALEKKMEKNLSPMEKQVLNLYLEGYDYVRIGEIMNRPPKSIDNALQRVRGKIKNAF